jgi:hypothetical protein
VATGGCGRFSSSLCLMVLVQALRRTTPTEIEIDRGQKTERQTDRQRQRREEEFGTHIRNLVDHTREQQRNPEHSAIQWWPSEASVMRKGRGHKPLCQHLWTSPPQPPSQLTRGWPALWNDSILFGYDC